MNNVTVIDSKRGLMPRVFDRIGGDASDPMVKARLAALQDKAASRDAHGILELVLREEFAGKIGLAAFGGGYTFGAAIHLKG